MVALSSRFVVIALEWSIDDGEGEFRQGIEFAEPTSSRLDAGQLDFQSFRVNLSAVGGEIVPAVGFCANHYGDVEPAIALGRQQLIKFRFVQRVRVVAVGFSSEHRTYSKVIDFRRVLANTVLPEARVGEEVFE
jgi:hypothetical protein